MSKDQDINQTKNQNNLLRNKLKLAIEREKKNRGSNKHDNDDTLEQLVNLDLTTNQTKGPRWSDLKEQMNSINNQDYHLPNTTTRSNTPPRSRKTTPPPKTRVVSDKDHNLLDQINQLNQTIKSLNVQLQQEKLERKDLIEEFQIKETKMITSHNKQIKDLKHKYNHELQAVQDQLTNSSDQNSNLKLENQQYKQVINKLDIKLSDLKSKYDKLNLKYQIQRQQSQSQQHQNQERNIFSEQQPNDIPEHRYIPEQTSDIPEHRELPKPTIFYNKLKPTGQVIDSSDSDSDDDLLQQQQQHTPPLSLSPIQTQPFESSNTQLLLDKSTNRIGNKFQPQLSHDDDTNYLLRTPNN
ncbi:hypothetical protein JA1_003309 [Spathaspora sp. JA1]|nr:hypothetical protein JA1_003309 [Spathaspora sp. JA1]